MTLKCSLDSWIDTFNNMKMENNQLKFEVNTLRSNIHVLELVEVGKSDIINQANKRIFQSQNVLLFNTPVFGNCNEDKNDSVVFENISIPTLSSIDLKLSYVDIKLLGTSPSSCRPYFALYLMILLKLFSYKSQPSVGI